jgi:hypothetical protein
MRESHSTCEGDNRRFVGTRRQAVPSSPNPAATAASHLVNRPRRRHPRIKFDLAECAFIPLHVLLQESEKRLGLLRAQVNSLKILDLDMAFGLLLQRPEDHKKVPDIHAHLHTVRIVLSVIGIIR